MPGAAAGLPNFLAGHPHPLEVRGRSKHFAQQFSITNLDLGSFAQGQPCFGDAIRELVANLLQLTQSEHPWRRRNGANSVLDLGVAEGPRKERGELSFEARDLTAQLRPSETLVDIDAEPGETVS